MTTPGSTSRFARLAATTQAQHGLFTLAQAKAAGLSRGMIDHRVRTGELVTVDERVFRSVLTPESWHQQLLGVCLAGPAVASHRSASALWRAPDATTDIVEATALRHRRRKPSTVVWHESYLLDCDQITEVDAVPVTTPTRTVVDLGATATTDELVRVLDDFTRRSLTSPERVARLLDRLGAMRPGYRNVEAALHRRIGPDPSATPESDLETVFDNLLRNAGLPSPERQHRVRLPDGRWVRIDFAYPERLLGIEVMGGQFHATPQRWAADVERVGALGAAGWLVLMFSDDQVRRTPDVVVAAVRHGLSR